MLLSLFSVEGNRILADKRINPNIRVIMHIHEYQAKELLRRYGVTVPDFAVVSDVEEAKRVVADLGTEKVVVKVMVHAGGRGKAGGVKIAENGEEAVLFAQEMLGMKIVNRQTGKEGVVAEKVMIAPLTDIDKQYYLSCAIDRERGCATLIASPEGGVEIEEVAEKDPDKILKIPVSLGGRLRSYQLFELAKFMGWKGDVAKQGMRTAQAMAKAFFDNDCSLLEINPLALTPEGNIVALDAKCSIDDNALFRHPKISSMYDPSQSPSREAEAEKHDLSYIALDGNIGCMVNGAGLAMATMDIISHFGGMPANFLDVGGGATAEKVAEGFKIIASDPNVKAILVNIFGGIMNCETVAEGIVAAGGAFVPLVLRMEGTGVEEGKQKLVAAGIDVVVADSMATAAEKVVACTKGN